MAALGCLQSQARAETPALAAPASPMAADWLEVEPGLSCLEAERLEALIAMWLSKPHVATDAHVLVRGDRQRARLVELVITRDGATSTRVFDPVPAGCDEAHAAVSLVIALAIEPDVAAGILPSESEPREPLDAALTVQLAGASALLPSWSLGFAAGADLWFLPWLGARAELFMQHARNNTVRGTSGTFDATLLGGDVRGCAGGKPGSRVRIALCTGIGLGALNGRGHDYERSYSPTGFWAGITSGLRLELDAGLPWQLDVTAVLPLRAQPFTVARAGDSEAVAEPSGAALLLGLGVRVPL